jgi:transposase InsO family protein
MRWTKCRNGRWREPTQQIGEAYLLPVLEGMLAQFPFRIQSFYSDKGREFINHTVAKPLNKLLIERTKSRPRHSNDNGLVESKNGAVVRNTWDTTTSPRRTQWRSGPSMSATSNPFLKFHRPRGVPEEVSDAKGR